MHAWALRPGHLRWLAVAALLMASTAPAQFQRRGVPVGDDGVITRDNLDADEEWPLTIDRATFVCDGEAVFLATGSVQYPLNGSAKGLAKQHPEGRKPLEDVWRRDEKVMQDIETAARPVSVVRVNITPVLARGERFCRDKLYVR